MPALQVTIQNFSGTTVLGLQGDHCPRRDLTASGFMTLVADIVFQPDHIWFWVEKQEGEDYKANIEVKWKERNLVLFRLINGDGVKGEAARIKSPKFKGQIDALPSQVREDYSTREKTDMVYHIDDFAF
ncbi:MAG: hypothetical protein ACLFQV_04700 [Vulcanimicrobiota bacterium]